MFSLQCPSSQLSKYASRYRYEDDEVVATAEAFMQEHRYLTREHFLALCRWKSPRSGPRCAENSEGYIEAVTRVALGTDDERLRIEVLTLLAGVSWPTASVVLHFGHREGYPILDFRALWSLGVTAPPRYTFDLWMPYTEYCRALARKQKLSMRELDRALWQYSKEHQSSAGGDAD